MAQKRLRTAGLHNHPHFQQAFEYKHVPIYKSKNAGSVRELIKLNLIVALSAEQQNGA